MTLFPYTTLFRSSLSVRFSLKNLGALHYFLGIQVTNTSDGLLLSQPKYFQDLLIRSKMDGAKPISTPLAPGETLSKHLNSCMLQPMIIGAPSNEFFAT